MGFWSLDAIEHLRRLRAAGVSSYQIATELGCSHVQILNKSNAIGLRKRADTSEKIRTGWAADKELYARAKTLRAEGLSYSRIGQALGGLTKAQVQRIGRQDRWDGDPEPLPVLPVAPMALPEVVAPEPIRQSPVLAFLAMPISRPRSCQYPLNSGILPSGKRGWIFCEVPTMGEVYCPSHRRVCYQRPLRQQFAAT